jgi:two-component system, NarL family, response regulator
MRILIVDDHPVVRAGLRALIATKPGLEVVGEAGDGEEGVRLHALLRPDVVLMDLRMPGLDGVAATRAIRSQDPDVRVLMLTTYDGDADIRRAFEAGACGYLLKDTAAEAIEDAIRWAARGGRVIPTRLAARLAEFEAARNLTPRELEVLEYVSQGLGNRAIGRAIGRTEETVKVHLKHIMTKLGAHDRTQAVTLGLQRGVIHLNH